MKKTTEQDEEKNKNIIKTIIIIFILIVVAVIIRIYIIRESPYLQNKELAINKCVELCQHVRKFEGIDSQGPCLKEEIVPGWGCDVVHNPRLPLIDDNKKNRCVDSRHVVEVNFVCELMSAK